MRNLLAGAVALIALGLGASAHAGNLIVNGDFETGDYKGWKTSIEPCSAGGLFVVPNNGGPAPLSFPSPPYSFNMAGGQYFSMSDEFGAGFYSLTQSFTLLLASEVTVSLVPR